MFNFIIFIIGFSSICAQTIILRELWVSFYGNELTLGIILSNWVIAGALGVFFVGRFIDKIENKINIFTSLQILFTLFLFLAVYLARSFKNILGIPFGQALGLPEIFFSSFCIILPLNFCLTGLFSAACAIARSIAKPYAWEAFGSIIAGLVLTYFLIPRFNSYEIIFFIFVLNLFVYCFIFRSLKGKAFRSISLVVIILSLIFFASRLDYLNQLSIKKQWPKKQVLEYRNSIYANIVVTKEGEQYSFFYNGIPIITAPYPDITFVEEFANLPLLFHPSPKNILIISGGSGGLINECLKHPIEKIVYAELDPLLIRMLEKYPTDLTKKELTDKRVKVVNIDGRFYLKNQADLYDVILIGISKPSELSTNRLFTQEFFSLAKKRLEANGILAFWLHGSLTYMSRELKDFDASILNGLPSSYRYIRIIPGDYHIVLASDSEDIGVINPQDIFRRIEERRIKTKLLLPAYLNYRLDKKHEAWLKKSMLGSTTKINQDFLPLAVFEAVILWNKQFSPGLAQFLEALQNLRLSWIVIFMFFITWILVYFKARQGIGIVYSIFTTGFFGMLTSLILIFSFQVIYGYLYYKIGLLISIFMAGIALGSILMSNNLKISKDDLKLFILLDVLLLVFSISLTFIILSLLKLAAYSGLIFLGLFFIPGLVLGLEFPLAAKLYQAKTAKIGEIVGLLYAADLAGGWLAGLCTGIVFLPILGLFGSCLVVVILKLSSLILLLSTSKNLT